MPAPAASTAAHSIVLVEDDSFIAGMYVTMFLKENIKIDLATDGEAGWKLIQTKHPHLVLLDLKLPKRSGWEILKALKNDPALRDVAVIVLTNTSEPVDVQRALSMGALDYLVKVNLEPREVLARVMRHLATLPLHI